MGGAADSDKAVMLYASKTPQLLYTNQPLNQVTTAVHNTCNYGDGAGIIDARARGIFWLQTGLNRIQGVFVNAALSNPVPAA